MRFSMAGSGVGGAPVAALGNKARAMAKRIGAKSRLAFMRHLRGRESRSRRILPTWAAASPEPDVPPGGTPAILGVEGGEA